MLYKYFGGVLRSNTQYEPESISQVFSIKVNILHTPNTESYGNNFSSFRREFETLYILRFLCNIYFVSM